MRRLRQTDHNRRKVQHVAAVLTGNLHHRCARANADLSAWTDDRRGHDIARYPLVRQPTCWAICAYTFRLHPLRELLLLRRIEWYGISFVFGPPCRLVGHWRRRT